MKKITFLTVVLTLVLTMTAYAADDLKSLSVAQLLTLRSSIEAELLARNEAKFFNVPPGSYIVGEDIPAGIYAVTISNSSSAVALITVYPTKDAMEKQIPFSTMEMLSGVTDNPSIGKLELLGGMCVSVSMGVLTFEIYRGIAF